MALREVATEFKPVGFITVPAMELPTEDGEPLETSWHRDEINLLIETLGVHWQDRNDFYAGGNMFIYYHFGQARERKYRGPDVFVTLGVNGSYPRSAWVVWEEGGKYPDVIIELLSPSTATEDLTTKKELYESTFRTPEYFCYDPDAFDLKGWRLTDTQYKEIEPSDRGWLWSKRLKLWLGLWDGRYLKYNRTWLRFYDENEALVPTVGEFEARHAEEERQRADEEAEARRQAEAQAAEQAEARRQAEAQAAEETEARRQAEARAQDAEAGLAELQAAFEALRQQSAKA